MPHYASLLHPPQPFIQDWHAKSVQIEISANFEGVSVPLAWFYRKYNTIINLLDRFLFHTAVKTSTND